MIDLLLPIHDRLSIAPSSYLVKALIEEIIITMAERSGWSAEVQKDCEENDPVPPYSRCTAIRDFIGQQPQDLSFCCGEQLTIIEPCNVMYWYLAENSEGKRGVMPINFVEVHSNSRRLPPSSIKSKGKLPTPHEVQLQLSKVPPPVPASLSSAPAPPLPPKPKRVPGVSRSSQSGLITGNVPVTGSVNNHNCIASSLPKTHEPSVDIDSRPPAPLPPEASNKTTTFNTCDSTKYQTQKEFIERSGWFTPSLESVLCKKANFNWSSLTATSAALYLFLHKSDEKKRYIGKSRNCYHELVQMFHRLFEKPEAKLSPIEMEIKYFNPDADSWHFRLYPVPFPDNLEAELSYKIVHHGTLHPNGLNPEIKFTSKEQFYIFAENYIKLIRERSSKAKKMGSSLTTRK